MYVDFGSLCLIVNYSKEKLKSPLAGDQGGGEKQGSRDVGESAAGGGGGRRGGRKKKSYSQ